MDISSSPYPSLQNPNIPSLRPANSAAFKRENRRKRKERKRQEKLLLLLEDWAPLTDHRRSSASIAPAASVADWPLEPVTDQNPDSTFWNLNTRQGSPAQPRPLAPAEDLVQEKALRSCREFFAPEDGSDEEDGAVDDHSGGTSYEFLKGIFVKGDLRDLYRKDWEKGGFYCLVCGGIGKNLGKKFVGLVAVVQHANFISKTKRKIAHRAYGRVVYELLCLEIDGFKGVYFDDNAADTDSQDEEALKGAMEDAGEDGADLMVGDLV